MQIFYAVLFILMSVVCGLACLVIPKMRRYALQVLVAPVAFGFCSIIGMGMILLLSDYTRILHFAVLNEPAVGIRGFMITSVIYFIPGVLGAWVAVSLAGRLKARLSK